jgi:hypothetical protein
MLFTALAILARLLAHGVNVNACYVEHCFDHYGRFRYLDQQRSTSGLLPPEIAAKEFPGMHALSGRFVRRELDEPISMRVPPLVQAASLFSYQQHTIGDGERSLAFWALLAAPGIDAGAAAAPGGATALMVAASCNAVHASKGGSSERYQQLRERLFAKPYWSKEKFSGLRAPAVAALLARDDCAPNARDAFGFTALHHACATGNIAAARLLLADARVDVNARESERGRTALMLVCCEHEGFADAPDTLPAAPRSLAQEAEAARAAGGALAPASAAAAAAAVALRPECSRCGCWERERFGERVCWCEPCFDFGCDVGAPVAQLSRSTRDASHFLRSTDPLMCREAAEVQVNYYGNVSPFDTLLLIRASRERQGLSTPDALLLRRALPRRRAEAEAAAVFERERARLALLSDSELHNELFRGGGVRFERARRLVREGPSDRRLLVNALLTTLPPTAAGEVREKEAAAVVRARESAATEFRRAKALAQAEQDRLLSHASLPRDECVRCGCRNEMREGERVCFCDTCIDAGCDVPNKRAGVGAAQEGAASDAADAAVRGDAAASGAGAGAGAGVGAGVDAGARTDGASGAKEGAGAADRGGAIASAAKAALRPRPLRDFYEQARLFGAASMHAAEETAAVVAAAAAARTKAAEEAPELEELEARAPTPAELDARLDAARMAAGLATSATLNAWARAAGASGPGPGPGRRLEVLSALLGEPRVRPWLRDADGNTALALARLSRRSAVAEALVAHEEAAAAAAAAAAAENAETAASE